MIIVRDDVKLIPARDGFKLILDGNPMFKITTLFSPIFCEETYCF
jgi:hypothetical protein